MCSELLECSLEIRTASLLKIPPCDNEVIVFFLAFEELQSTSSLV